MSANVKVNYNLQKISKLSFEEALNELQDIVTTLENGEKNLDESISAFEYGTKLSKHCEELLSKAKLKIEQINSNVVAQILEENDE